MICFDELAIIIPLAPKERAWRFLLQDLEALSKSVEVIFVAVDGTSIDPVLQAHSSRFSHIQFLTSSQGRGRQLNAGAHATERSYLWFLHADSRLDSSSLNALQMALKKFPNALHYFNLRFLADGPPLMFVNTFGCWIRSHFMGVPFGDQGFCLSKSNHLKIGGFPEDVIYGEDHLFVWMARHAGMKLKCTGASIKTSARRYRDSGWLKTTVQYARLWTAQAFPQWVKLLLKRGGV